MKIEFEAETSEHGPGYLLRPEGSGEEQRWLTILCDLAQRPDIILRVVGAKRSEKSIPSQPPNPVDMLKIRLEKRDGSAPRAAELLAAERAAILDPSRPTPRRESVRRTTAVSNARNRGLRIVRDGKHLIIEE